MPDCPQAALEAPAWSAAATLELHVIPIAGHDIHLHEVGPRAEFEYIRNWLAVKFPN